MAKTAQEKAAAKAAKQAEKAAAKAALETEKVGAQGEGETPEPETPTVPVSKLGYYKHLAVVKRVEKVVNEKLWIEVKTADGATYLLDPVTVDQVVSVEPTAVPK